MSSVRESAQPKHTFAWLLFVFRAFRNVEDVCEDAVATRPAIVYSRRSQMYDVDQLTGARYPNVTESRHEAGLQTLDFWILVFLDFWVLGSLDFLVFGRKTLENN